MSQAAVASHAHRFARNARRSQQHASHATLDTVLLEKPANMSVLLGSFLMEGFVNHAMKTATLVIKLRYFALAAQIQLMFSWTTEFVSNLARPAI
jgi:23S rRNA C2498 (ribose-2'-O)-methylase RlmM